MITVLNRKNLIALSDSKELADIRLKLKNKNIPFEVKTTRSRSAFGIGIDVKTYSATHINQPYSEKNQHISFIYYIYVRKKDYLIAFTTIKE